MLYPEKKAPAAYRRCNKLTARRRVEKRRLPMTVCAAAICTARWADGLDKSVLLGVSDRMITSGDIEFEAFQTKIYPFGPPAKALCLGAGDSNSIITLVTETARRIQNEGITEIKDVARLYADSFSWLRRRRAEQIYLAPLGLDINSFLSKQKDMNPELVAVLTERLQSERLGVEVIVSGVDISGPHIYYIADPGMETCYDNVGFCAIGSGARQFETAFMTLGYSRFWSLSAALLLMYSAKKKAEVSPGVGRETDMFLAQEGGWGFIAEPWHQALEEYNKELDKTVAEKRDELHKRMGNDERFKKKPEAQQGQPKVPAVEQGEIRSSAQEGKPQT
jgi:hypothetical protein